MMSNFATENYLKAIVKVLAEEGRIYGLRIRTGDPIPAKAQREYTVRDVPLSFFPEGALVRIV
ncbi:MAG: hypothetical protein WCT14_06235 [Treponemataceae bacterium]